MFQVSQLPRTARLLRSAQQGQMFQRTQARSIANHDTITEKDRLTSIRLYRILQRQCLTLAQVSRTSDFLQLKDDSILLQPTLKAPDWGRHSVFSSNKSSTNADHYRLFHLWMDEANRESFLTHMDDWLYETVGSSSDRGESEGSPIQTYWTTASQIQAAIRHAFRLEYKSFSDLSSLHSMTIRIIQMLKHQEQLWKQTSVATTEEVRVVATSLCIGKSPTAAPLPTSVDNSLYETKYRFAYRIRIENCSEHHMQVLGRHWHIQELEEDEVAPFSRSPIVVDAPTTGAVGQLPVLAPGEAFQYMSGTDLTTGIGMMKGTFYMARVLPNTQSAKSGDVVEALSLADKVQVEVAPFPLIAD